MLRWTKDTKKPEPPRTPEPRMPVRQAPPRVLTQTPVQRTPIVEAPPPPPETPDDGQVRKSLPELLLAQGRINAEQLQRAIAKQKETGAFIGEILVEEGILDENSLISFLAKHCKIPHLSLLDYLIDDKIVSLIPREVCLKYRLLPIDKLGRNLTVAMVNPLHQEALEKVQACCPELRIKPILCAHQHFETVTAKLFSQPEGDGPLEMTATSLGLSVSPTAAKRQETKPPVVPPPAPAPASPALDKVAAIPEAVEIVVDAEPESGDALFEGVFRQSADAAVEDGDDSESSVLMKEMATVMMDSMRGTYEMLARRMELFQGLDAEDVARIFAKGITVEFEAGDTIFEKGAPGDKLYAILGGEVSIVDEDHELAILERGDMFGEMALVSEAPRSASAKALTSTSLLALSLDTIRHTMPSEVSIQLLINIIVTISARLRRANESYVPQDE